MDDEVERRLQALKGAPDGGGAQGAGGPAGAHGSSAEGAGDPLRGEVIEPGAGPSRPPEGGAGRGGDRRGSGPAVRAVSWSIGEAQAGRLGLWFGLAILAFGVYLVVVEFVPGARIVGSVAILALGIWALLWRAIGRAGAWALYVGAVLAGYGAGGTVGNLVADGRGGWGSLGVGIAFLALAGWRAARGRGLGWQAWMGGILTLWGGWGALSTVVPGFPSAGDLVIPVVLVAIGLLVVRGGLR